MTVKEKVLSLIKEGKFEGTTEAAVKLQCSGQAVWYAIQALLAEGRISPQSPYKAN